MSSGTPGITQGWTQLSNVPFDPKSYALDGAAAFWEMPRADSSCRFKGLAELGVLGVKPSRNT